MSEFFFQAGISNLCVSFFLAILAIFAEKIIKRPQLSHLLWLLVLIKLLTPPLFIIGIFEDPTPPLRESKRKIEILEEKVVNLPLLEKNKSISTFERTKPEVYSKIKIAFLFVWFFGSLFFFFFSLAKVYQFNRLLQKESKRGPPSLQLLSEEIAKKLSLKKIPTIHTISAQISPMVWWTGGKVKIFVPEALFRGMESSQFYWVLAHELAHVKRRDHFVRWIEWFALVCFWWTPLIWWARSHLRENEEICCDNLVLSCFEPHPKSYANTLLTTVEYLSSSLCCPPLVASAFNNSNFLERRFKMILSKNSNRSHSLWLKGAVILYAMLVLPLGLAYSQNKKEEKEEPRINKGGIQKKHIVSLEFHNASIYEMVDKIQKQTGIDIIVEPGISGTMILAFSNVYWLDALHLIAKNFKCEVIKTSEDSWEVRQPVMVNLEFENTDLREVINTIAVIGNTNIIYSENVQGKVNLHLKDIPWREALEEVTRKNR